ncbi:acetylcholine receptor subunit beta-like 2 isoform X2 [Sitophilus oryzae]|uniref:Acetylcholine receptor subunit beta-like 2 isoform X2 n=1 Tax=Sitophilus oryzae TaxID=7048 RepID=A0A6J2XDN9_SITOR|nr:acetylcholine receptor subunit beta-like 2 isoform X2 [Sitophilus oryzae]
MILLKIALISFFLNCCYAEVKHIEANPDAKRLYDDLLSNYNRLIRPVINHTETLTVWLSLKLSQLIEMNLKNQVMTTNLWVVQKWNDYKLRWDPEEYGGIEMLYVPSEHIWLPDIVLFNNADGNYEVTLMTKATLKYTGDVVWKPPSIYKSSCEINVQYFPFDEQSCLMKFASWTYNGLQVDLKHMDQHAGSNIIKVGIDLSEFYLSVEWDILAVPATRNEEYYPDSQEPFSDITFKITMRRKTLFYTVNLIIPCVGITFLTVLVFYLPSDSGEKVTLCVSILLSLTVFFLLLAEIIPPTSLAVPLLGKYLLFTMILVTSSIWVTVCVLNVHFRSPSTHKMSPLFRKIFLHIMPKMLIMRRTTYTIPEYDDSQPPRGYSNGDMDLQLNMGEPFTSDFKITTREPSFVLQNTNQDDMGKMKAHSSMGGSSTNITPKNLSANVLAALEGVRFIAQHIRDADKDNEIIEDWKFVSMVLDRFFLWVFTLACISGTCGIIFQAPSLYDTRIPVDQKLSEIPLHKIFQNQLPPPLAPGLTPV